MKIVISYQPIDNQSQNRFGLPAQFTEENNSIVRQVVMGTNIRAAIFQL